MSSPPQKTETKERSPNYEKDHISLLLALVMALSLAACAVQPRQEDYQSVNIRLGGLKGPTSMGMAKLLDDAENGLTANTYEFTMAASANELTPKLIQGELDILAVPANVGAILYNQTQGQVELGCRQHPGRAVHCGKGRPDRDRCEVPGRQDHLCHRQGRHP